MKLNDPTPTLPLPGEGADSAPCKQPSSGTTSPSSWQGGGREGVKGFAPYSSSQTIFNSLNKKPLRQTLRRNLTPAERLLWQRIRNKQLGVKFRRQHGIGRYIADFYSAECALVIELDGGSHFSEDAQHYDQVRENFMKAVGVQTLRFSNRDIAENIEGVMASIANALGHLSNGSGDFN